MRVVFDTTVLVDGLFDAQSASNKALKQVKYGRVQLITSPSILGELKAIAQGERFHQTELRAWILATGIASLANVTLVEPRDVPKVVAADVLDDHVVAAAVCAKADLIVATDHHLLELKEHQGIRIVTPEEFLVIIGVAKAPKEPGKPAPPKGKRPAPAPKEGKSPTLPKALPPATKPVRGGLENI